MVCFRYIIVNTQHKGDNKDDDDDNNNNNNNNNVWVMVSLGFFFKFVNSLKTTSKTGFITGLPKPVLTSPTLKVDF